MPELHGSLRSLIAQGEEFAAASPGDAAAGLWWPRGRERMSAISRMAAPSRVRHAAVLVLLWEDDDGPQLLLTERSTALAKHPGQISFPGGAAEPSDSGPVGTALRESQEEVDLDPARVSVLGELPPALIPVTGFHVTPVLGVTDDVGVLTPHSAEVARVIRAPLADLVEPKHRYTAVIERGGITFPTPAFLFAEGTDRATFVWGFTGVLLDQMLDRLGWAQPWDSERTLDPRRFKR